MTFASMVQGPAHESTFQLDPEQLEKLIDKLHQYLFVKDLQGRFIYANMNFVELMGASNFEEIRHKTDGSFFRKDLVTMFRTVDKHVQESEEDWEGEETINFPCGGRRVIWVNKTPLRDRNGKVVGIVGIFVDVTRNRKEYHQYLTKKTNDLAHEILIPVQAIASNLENLIAHEVGTLTLTKEERDTALRTSLSQMHVLGLAGENTQKALLGQAEKQYVFRKHDIRQVLKDCMGALDGFADQKDIELRPITVQGDLSGLFYIEMSHPDLLRAFKNLYHNALKYSYTGSGSNSPYAYRWVATRISKAGNRKICIAIENYGIGIQEDEIELVLEEGYRGRLSIDRHRTGSGLGLSEVKKIVERHGGGVFVVSEKKGRPWKTTVTTLLPCNQDADAVRYHDDLEAVLTSSENTTKSTSGVV